jgi:hypothetical protein
MPHQRRQVVDDDGHADLVDRLFVLIWMARSAIVYPRKSHTSPVRVSSSASSSLIGVPDAVVASAAALVKGTGLGGLGRGGGYRGGDRTGAAAPPHVHAGGDPGAATRPPRRSVRYRGSDPRLTRPPDRYDPAAWRPAAPNRPNRTALCAGAAREPRL